MRCKKKKLIIKKNNSRNEKRKNIRQVKFIKKRLIVIRGNNENW